MAPRFDHLTDMKPSPYILRTASTITNEAKALIAIIKTYGWTYISIVHSNDSASIMKAKYLSDELQRKGVCVAKLENIGGDPKETSLNQVNRLKKILKKLQEATGSVVIVAIPSFKDFRLLTLTISNLG